MKHEKGKDATVGIVRLACPIQHLTNTSPPLFLMEFAEGYHPDITFILDISPFFLKCPMNKIHLLCVVLLSPAVPLGDFFNGQAHLVAEISAGVHDPEGAFSQNHPLSVLVVLIIVLRREPAGELSIGPFWCYSKIPRL